jgi:hypothetical protein
VTVRWVVPLAAIAVLVAACGQHAGHAGSGDKGAASRAPVVSFDAFLASIRSATYRGYAARPGAKVRSDRAFDEMRGFLLGRYRHARVVHSYSVDGVVFDCLQRHGTSVPAPTPARSPGGSGAAAPNAAAAGTAAAGEAGGGEAGGGCPDGSVPVRRITLAEMVRFPTLKEFLSKGPGGSGGLPTVP